MRRLFLIILSTIAFAACGSGNSPDAGTTAAAAGSTASALTPTERGAILYKRCRSCHTLEQGGRNKVGPNLWDVFGRTAGARDDFNYSAAMAGSDIVWTDETMSAYLENPSTYIPGNRMSFAGLRKDEDRAAVILYLRANTGADGVDETGG
jgi:cytochrome c